VSRLDQTLALTHGPSWANRLVLAPMTNRQSHADGSIGADEIEWLRRRAAGGFGLVVTCATHVSPEGQGWAGQLGAWSDAHVEGLSRLAAALRAEGAVSAVQLHHGGLRADAGLVSRRVALWETGDPGVDVLSTEQVQALVRAFVEAARRTEQAGFDGVQLHAAHGYLLGQFLDRAHNNRSDGYGSTAAGRARALLEIIAGIRAQASTGFQVGVRLSPERWGVDLDESLWLAERLLSSDAVDYVDVSLWDVGKHAEGAPHGPRLLEQFAQLPRGGARLGVSGKINSARIAQDCLDRGVDFVAVGTAAITHHDFATRVVDDPDFRAAGHPVAVHHLRAEGVGPAFVEYLREVRPTLVGD
jgi:2,4-dienoyl-CoA reductase-like NADH-dependent reductase (Old Yellow Enzyme family)